MSATLRLALLLLIGAVHADESCGPAPPAPPQSELWVVQISELRWRTEVPGWVAAPAPTCWVLGRVELVYTNDADTPPVSEPGPWIRGVDYPADDSCPIEAAGECYDIVDHKDLVRVP